MAKQIKEYILLPNNEQGRISFAVFLLIISLLFSMQWRDLGTVYICVFPDLELFLKSFPLRKITQGLFLLFSIAIIFSYKKYLFSTLTGFLLIVCIFLSDLLYSFNLAAAAIFLIIMGLSGGKSKYIAIQLAIIYFGAFLDKIYLKSWVSGGFIDSFFENQVIFKELLKLFSKEFLVWLFTILAIATEFILCVSFLFKRTRIYGIVIGLLFHFFTTIFMEQFFGIFLVVILVVYYSLTPDTANQIGKHKRPSFIYNKVMFTFFVALLSINTELMTLEFKQLILFLFVLILVPSSFKDVFKLSKYFNSNKNILSE
ncbi:hypothetical protein [Flavicella sediminum]|uniref:hypothetical protein n=1 Tax=Flavicella sediminum TaxID=2585141 RepID=UPI0011219FE2|nr:hypothetical protein [Flavicella sediminum]